MRAKVLDNREHLNMLEALRVWHVKNEVPRQQIGDKIAPAAATTTTTTDYYYYYLLGESSRKQEAQRSRRRRRRPLGCW